MRQLHPLSREKAPFQPRNAQARSVPELNPQTSHVRSRIRRWRKTGGNEARLDRRRTGPRRGQGGREEGLWTERKMDRDADGERWSGLVSTDGAVGQRQGLLAGSVERSEMENERHRQIHRAGPANPLQAARDANVDIFSIQLVSCSPDRSTVQVFASRWFLSLRVPEQRPERRARLGSFFSFKLHPCRFSTCPISTLGVYYTKEIPPTISPMPDTASYQSLLQDG